MTRPFVLVMLSLLLLFTTALPATADPAVKWGNKSCAIGTVWVRSYASGSIYHYHGSPLVLDQSWSGALAYRNSPTFETGTYWRVEVFGGILYDTQTYAWCGGS